MHDEFPEVLDQTDQIKELITHIKQCAFKIDELQGDKEGSEAKLRELLQHDKDGASTYDVAGHKVVVTTGLNYKFDKKKYLELLNAPEKIDPRFQLVKEVTELQINKKAIKDCDQFGSPQDRYLKSLFITTTDKKLHISIKEPKNESIGGDVGSVDDDGVFTPTSRS